MYVYVIKYFDSKMDEWEFYRGGYCAGDAARGLPKLYKSTKNARIALTQLLQRFDVNSAKIVRMYLEEVPG